MGHVLYACVYVTKSDGSLLPSERKRAAVTDKVDCSTTRQLDELLAFDELYGLITKEQETNNLIQLLCLFARHNFQS